MMSPRMMCRDLFSCTTQTPRPQCTLSAARPAVGEHSRKRIEVPCHFSAARSHTRRPLAAFFMLPFTCTSPRPPAPPRWLLWSACIALGKCTGDHVDLQEQRSPRRPALLVHNADARPLSGLMPRPAYLLRDTCKLRRRRQPPGMSSRLVKMLGRWELISPYMSGRGGAGVALPEEERQARH